MDRSMHVGDATLNPPLGRSAKASVTGVELAMVQDAVCECWRVIASDGES